MPRCLLVQTTNHLQRFVTVARRDVGVPERGRQDRPEITAASDSWTS